MHAQLLSPVWLFVTPWTIAHQAPLTMGFSRQEYWSGLPFPPPGYLPNLGIQLTSPASPELAGIFFTTSIPLEKAMAPHSSVLAQRIPGTGEPGGLPFLGSHRVGHDWNNLAAAGKPSSIIREIQTRTKVQSETPFYSDYSKKKNFSLIW